ncbi:MAG: class I SAM-dependent methyltransferase [Promicromonosporaceae bacterium]|nr:class I SAM-dependent methyltransferase [Promicromonosporaceae bacterium]
MNAPNPTTRLLLTEAQRLGLDLRSADLAVIGDPTGEIVAGLRSLGASRLRVHCDEITAERAVIAHLAAAGEKVRPAADGGTSPVVSEATTMAAAAADAAGAYPVTVYRRLDEALLAGVQLVVLALPKSLSALREVAEVTARHAAANVTVLGAGQVKHMTRTQNEVLAEWFKDVYATYGVGKSRGLVARGVRPEARRLRPTFPVWSVLAEPELQSTTGLDHFTVVAHGGVFAGARLDLGTRALLATASAWPRARRIVDLGCGTGILATVAALRYPDSQVLATDRSAAAIASTVATAQANGVTAAQVDPAASRSALGDLNGGRPEAAGTARVTAVRSDAGEDIPSSSADLILLNPPFHDRTEISTAAAQAMFATAARTLTPGGELWTVFNGHLPYRSILRRVVGPTGQVWHTPKFVVTRSTRVA